MPKVIIGKSFALNDEDGVDEFIELAKKVKPDLNTYFDVDDETHEKYYKIMNQIDELDSTLFVGCKDDFVITIGRIVEVDVQSEFGDEILPYE